MECNLGRRPSYGWRSILHGREVLKRGLLQRLGNGIDTKVWLDNWILDNEARAPRYNQMAVVDLTLSVVDLFIPNSFHWNRDTLQQLFTEDDVGRILNIRVPGNTLDTQVWGFSTDGVYTTKSGYKLLSAIHAVNNPPEQPVLPLEKSVWKRIWKIKAPSKLKHFLWKTLSGALAVKERLSTRGLNVDPRCSVCDGASESICHVLFHCSVAREVWLLSGFPLPPAGFSLNSMFLNLSYLLGCSSKVSIAEKLRLSFPWILWHLWKARNAFAFEQVCLAPASIMSSALEAADIWLTLNVASLNPQQTHHSASEPLCKWVKPNGNMIKCNFGASWAQESGLSGAAWIVRDANGVVRYHSRRAFSQVLSIVEAELLAVLWAVESMKSLKEDNIIFESSLLYAREALLWSSSSVQQVPVIHAINECLVSFRVWSLNHCSDMANRAATLIATSVTKDIRLQSYIARQGPVWLRQILEDDASVSS